MFFVLWGVPLGDTHWCYNGVVCDITREAYTRIEFISILSMLRGEFFKI